MIPLKQMYERNETALGKKVETWLCIQIIIFGGSHMSGVTVASQQPPSNHAPELFYL